MTRTLSSFPQVVIHKHQDFANDNMKVSFTFQSEEHAEAFKEHFIQQGYVKGQQEALQDLQFNARCVFKNLFGKEL